MSTSIQPPHCETILWTAARPSPVPLPAGLVVKNGSNRSRAHLLVHAHAGVADVDLDDAFTGCVTGLDRQDSSGRHRVARIDREVDEQPPQLVGVGGDHRQPAVEIHDQADARADHPAQHHLHVEHDRIHVQLPGNGAARSG